jgi:hypothetical protein
MPRWDSEPLSDQVVAQLLRALMSIPRRPENRLIPQGALVRGHRHSAEQDAVSNMESAPD